MLVIEGITKTFNKDSLNEKQLFKDFNLKVTGDDFITIIGSNGAGKSTLLNLISGDILCDDGKILLNERNITHLKPHKKGRLMSRVFQNPSLGTSPSLTIFENLSLALNKNKGYGLDFLVKKKQTQEIIQEILKLNLGLEHHLNTPVGLLSGGQRQALSLIMATLTQPEILLLDEHTAALDPETSKTILEITQDLINKYHIPTLMVTHNLIDALQYGNRLMMMDKGKIILDLNQKEKRLMTPEKLIEYFKKVKHSELSDSFVLSA